MQIGGWILDSGSYSHFLILVVVVKRRAHFYYMPKLDKEFYIMIFGKSNSKNHLNRHFEILRLAPA